MKAYDVLRLLLRGASTVATRAARAGTFSSRKRGVVGFLVVVGALCVRGAVADEPWKARFQTEAPAAWRALGENLGGYQGTRLTTTNSGKAAAETSKITFKFTPELALAVTESDAAATAYGLNPRYAFEIRRIGDSEWIIAKLARPGDPYYGELKEQALKLSRACLTSAAILFPSRLQQLVERPGFQLIDVRPVQRADEELAEATFRCEPSDRSEVRIRDGWLLLAPARAWSVREARADVHWPSDEAGTVSEDITYYNEYAPLPVVKVARVQSKARPEGPRAKELGITEPSRLEIVSEFDVHPLEKANERDFSLTAFGLPEPDRSATTLWVCLLLAGLALVLLAFWLRRGARKTRA